MLYLIYSRTPHVHTQIGSDYAMLASDSSLQERFVTAEDEGRVADVDLLRNVFYYDQVSVCVCVCVYVLRVCVNIFFMYVCVCGVGVRVFCLFVFLKFVLPLRI